MKHSRCAALALVFGVVGSNSCQRAKIQPDEAGSGVTPGATTPPGTAPTGGRGFTLPPPAPPAPPGAIDTCVADAHTARRSSVNLLFLVDVSASMAEAVPGSTRTKWDMAKDALGAFLSDPGSAGLQVALQFFPVPSTCFQGICVGPLNPPGPTPACPCPAGLTCLLADPPVAQPCPGLPPSCEVADYRQPAVGFAELPAAGPGFMAVYGAKALTFGTPTGPAVVGALDQLAAHLAATPGQRGALVLVTDGLPTECVPRDADGIALPIAAARQLIPSIPTFVVGVFTPDNMARGAVNIVTQLATAGGTTAFVITPGTDLTTRLQETFNQIRTLTVACEYAIPQPRAGTVDHDKVNVHVSGAMRDEDLLYVRNAAGCDPTRGGWYYDVDPAIGGTPSRVVVCDRSCKSLEGDPTLKVDLRFGCKTLVVD
jgi:hypothetical protein